MSPSEDLQAVAKRLLEEGAVDVVIGCGRGTLPLRSTPLFARSAEEAAGLVFDATCGANLVRYLRGRPDRAAVVVKACDARALVEAIKEKQLDPEKIVAITVPCEGVADADAVIRTLGAPELLAAGLNGAEVSVTTREGEKTLALDDILSERCRSCDAREPVIPEGIGIKVERVGGEAASPSAERAAALEEFEAKSPAERWEWLAGEASKCVLCYACRSACPMCYC
ncbi:MAG: 4Fe-4S ferredoxin, partial [Planctomycetota bacterium]